MRSLAPKLSGGRGRRGFQRGSLRRSSPGGFQAPLASEPVSASRNIFELRAADINDVSAQIRIVSQHRPWEMMIPRSNAEEAAKRQDRVSDVPGFLVDHDVID